MFRDKASRKANGKDMEKILKCVFFVIFLLMSGCSLKNLERSADREVSSIMSEKMKKIEGEKVPGFIPGIDESSRSETVFLTLKDAIVLAAKNNREYKSRQEDIYLNMLDLTYQRYLYRTRFGLTGDAGWDKGDGESFSGGLNLRLLRWLAQGAQITMNISEDFIKYLTGDRRKDVQTIISMNILQPLLRGAGKAIAQEDLVQAERSAIYSLRNFIRYQNSFSVDTTEKYLALLLSRNNLQNIYNNYESLKSARERMEMLADAGRQPPYEVDQARQSEFAAYQNWLRAKNAYETLMDNYKVFLGLARKDVLALDDRLLEHLIDSGIEKPAIEPQEFMDAALMKRLDLMTDYDEVEDARRRINVALNRMKPRIDAELSVTGSTETRSYPNLDFNQPSYRAGIIFDLPLDRLPDRNNYKKALIDLNKRQRDFESRRDSIILEVDQQYRNLGEYYQSYLIQLNSLKLAEKRIESTNLLLQAGRATARDLLEAEESYLQAKNSLSASVTNYLVSYLKLLYSAERLELDDTGLWKGDLYEKITKEDI